MRNLKKLLALVLAMMMALSLMVTANATTTGTAFSDDYQITEEFIEAAEVLTGMKVFQGDNGSFRPASQITRGEMAALIYRLATGDTASTKMDLYSTTTPFTDVQPTDWFAGYVGYCWNAGYIKGRNETNTIFDPYGNVTGYEALAMVLRAMGYDQNGEFSGVSWTQRVASISQQRGLLDDIKSTNYANTLHMASRRDVVASILFQAAQKDRVTYTPAYGYQTGDHLQSPGTSDETGRYDDYTPLGVLNFNLAWTRGNVLGNQMTGESKTILSDAGIRTGDRYDTKNAAGYKNNHYDLTGGANNPNKTLNLNLTTGLDMIGHKMKVWYKNDTASNKAVYAYYDEATKTDVVKAHNTNLKDASGVGSITNLRDAATSAGFSIASNNRAVFNNSFGRFGCEAKYWNKDIAIPAAATYDAGTGVATDGSNAGTGLTPPSVSTDPDDYTEGFVSPVDLYLLISNGGTTVNVVIALNVEVSKITETNIVNRVPTIGMPVENWADNAPKTAPPSKGDYVASSSAGDGTFFVSDNNVKDPNGSVTDINDSTGVIAQAALLGNSTKTLGDYEFGIHITGTTNKGLGRDTISALEKTAIDVTGTKSADEQGYFLLSKITNVAEGTVVAYNSTAGTVTLNDGTVLERSKFYDTVVGTEKNRGVVGNNVPETALPQAWTQGVNGVSPVWVEGYASVGYKFYLDYEGKYLGAERSSGSSFLYGTYQDYSQETSTSTFNYFITGVNLNGEVETKQVKRFWADLASASDIAAIINGTDALKIPFRDSNAGSGSTNGLGGATTAGFQYRGFAISGDIADGINDDTGANRNEYLNNMARLGVKQANNTNTGASSDFTKIDIGRDQITLGAVETNVGTSNKYFTEGTKFILVDGYGTDTVKPVVYNGISELRGNSSQVTIELTTGSCNVALSTGWTASPADEMTYYTESPYTYAQSGNTAMKIDTIILPKEAVTWVGGNSLYYLGDPNPVLMNSFGQDAWKYGMYVDGERREVWLSNQPNTLTNDQFYQLQATNNVANDGQPIYNAGAYTTGTTAFVNPSTIVGATYNNGWVDGQYGNWNGSNKTGAITRATYSATTQDAQTATFTFVDGSNTQLFRVAGAKVVNLNVSTSQGGYIWPGITDLTTLNQAGSINPVTGRSLKVSAVYDPANPLVVTAIYVCWNQTV